MGLLAAAVAYLAEDVLVYAIALPVLGACSMFQIDLTPNETIAEPEPKYRHLADLVDARPACVTGTLVRCQLEHMRISIFAKSFETANGYMGRKETLERLEKLFPPVESNP